MVEGKGGAPLLPADGTLVTVCFLITLCTIWYTKYLTTLVTMDAYTVAWVGAFAAYLCS